MYAYSDMESWHRHNFLSFQSIFCSILELKFGKNVKKCLEILFFYTYLPLIKIICTPDMMYGSWDMKFSRQNYSELFRKNQKWKKNPGDVIILHKCTKNHDHLLYFLKDVSRDGCNCLFFICAIFSSFTPLQPKNSKCQKNEINSLRYHYLTQVYQKSWSYAILLLRYGT